MAIGYRLWLVALMVSDISKVCGVVCGVRGGSFYGLSVGFQLWVPLAKAQSSAVAAH